MKKHLLGLAIFSFIVVSFASVFAFLYSSKKPQFQQNEVVRQPVFEAESRNRCNKKPKNISFEIISTQYDFSKKELITKVRMKLDSRGTPESVSVGANLYFDGQVKGDGIKEMKRTLIQWYEGEEKDETVFVFVSQFNRNNEIKQNENLYAVFNFIPKFADDANSGRFYKTDPTSVLFIHGETIIEKNMKSRDNSKILY